MSVIQQAKRFLRARNWLRLAIVLAAYFLSRSLWTRPYPPDLMVTSRPGTTRFPLDGHTDGSRLLLVETDHKTTELQIQAYDFDQASLSTLMRVQPPAAAQEVTAFVDDRQRFMHLRYFLPGTTKSDRSQRYEIHDLYGTGILRPQPTLPGWQVFPCAFATQDGRWHLTRETEPATERRFERLVVRDWDNPDWTKIWEPEPQPDGRYWLPRAGHGGVRFSPDDRQLAILWHLAKDLSHESACTQIRFYDWPTGVETSRTELPTIETLLPPNLLDPPAHVPADTLHKEVWRLAGDPNGRSTLVVRLACQARIHWVGFELRWDDPRAPLERDESMCWIEQPNGPRQPYVTAMLQPANRGAIRIENILGTARPRWFRNLIVNNKILFRPLFLDLLDPSSQRAVLVDHSSGRTLWSTKLPKDEIEIALATANGEFVFSLGSKSGTDSWVWRTQPRIRWRRVAEVMGVLAVTGGLLWCWRPRRVG